MSKYCSNCGSVLNDDAKFCQNCGAKQELTGTGSWQNSGGGEYHDASYRDYDNNYNNYDNYSNRNSESGKMAPEPVVILILGILSLLFCESVILGLVFGIITLVMAKNYREATGELNGLAKAGKIFAIVGVVLSAICLLIWIILIGVGILGATLS